MCGDDSHLLSSELPLVSFLHLAPDKSDSHDLFRETNSFQVGIKGHFRSYITKPGTLLHVHYMFITIKKL